MPLGAAIAVALLITGCPDLELVDGECRCLGEPEEPAVCAEYFQACIDAAAQAFIIDHSRIGWELAGQVFERHQATCVEGRATCRRQAIEAEAPDGGVR